MVKTPLKPKPPTVPPPPRGTASLRDSVFEVLDLLEVPAPRHLLQDVLACRGIVVELGQLTRMRRAEDRAFQARPTESERFLAPAISCLDLSAVPGTLTCSTWPLEARLVGMYTPRTRHLRVLLRLLDEPPQLDADRCQRLLARYAETVPRAMERGRMREPIKVRQAAQAELDAIEPLDLAERRAAGTRLGALARTFQLWGQPAVLLSSPIADRVESTREVPA